MAKRRKAGGAVSGIIGIVVLGCCILSVIGIFLDRGTPTQSNNPSDRPSPTVENPEPTPTNTSNSGKVGDMLRVRGVTFKVIGAFVARVPNSDIEFLQTKTIPYLVVNIEIENSGRQDGLLADVDEDFRLFDDQGNDYGTPVAPYIAEKVSKLSSIYLDSDWTGRPAQLPFGKRATGVVVFELKERATAYRLRYDAAVGTTFQVSLNSDDIEAP